MSVRIIEGVLRNFHAPLGTVKIPSGHVRLYHYTKADPERIRREGILLSRSRGSSYGEPDAVWASTRPPDPATHNIVEFHVPADDPAFDLDHPGKFPDAGEWGRGYHHCVLYRDVKPSEIVQVHEPWHSFYELVLSEPDKLEEVLAGEYDWILSRRGDHPDEARAIAELKRLHGRRR